MGSDRPACRQTQHAGNTDLIDKRVIYPGQFPDGLCSFWEVAGFAHHWAWWYCSKPAPSCKVQHLHQHAGLSRCSLQSATTRTPVSTTNRCASYVTAFLRMSRTKLTKSSRFVPRSFSLICLSSQPWISGACWNWGGSTTACDRSERFTEVGRLHSLRKEQGTTLDNGQGQSKRLNNQRARPQLSVKGACQRSTAFLTRIRAASPSTRMIRHLRSQRTSSRVPDWLPATEHENLHG